MTTAQDMRIGDAATALGIETHVLRHWESVGLLAPPRSPSGHRSYNDHILDYARVIQKLQRTGLSLDQIRRLGLGNCDDRLAMIAERRAEVRERIALLEATDRFLDHLTECSHPVISECPRCSEFAARQNDPGLMKRSVR
ncbi:MerR family transcriptional regulator [Nocardia seriolae]|uniref:MerR family transcriptional regulator n=1 Tax=Nocardia seriolae TaxID=37332 RepID=UPI0012BC3DCB|nr:MerR family transcriptional regulator [Nocardia seriolae]MTJ63630.1 MerR family transcriptional regulator [Nocardia seriolae]MTJ74316.1 MerR family transcriptional regulator [Nocardia seriolae]MTJ88201.1 MerR family transcriptional regulator [Nocardia seriolae]MTK32189.1 MerR family transcriptional regulator [Nocardia seriolae]MTK41530.1 MerR family transcriptional regulator [Nocardia seriolae]